MTDSATAEKPKKFQLGELLSVEQIQSLYNNMENQFGSPLMDMSITRFLDTCRVAKAKEDQSMAALISQTGDDAMKTAIKLFGTNDVMRTRALIVIEAYLDQHAKAFAPALEKALLKAGVTPEQIAGLPRNKDGTINDTSDAGPNCGVSVLLREVYEPQLTKLYSKNHPGYNPNAVVSAPAVAGKVAQVDGLAQGQG